VLLGERCIALSPIARALAFPPCRLRRLSQLQRWVGHGAPGVKEHPHVGLLCLGGFTTGSPSRSRNVFVLSALAWLMKETAWSAALSGVSSVRKSRNQYLGRLTTSPMPSGLNSKSLRHMPFDS